MGTSPSAPETRRRRCPCSNARAAAWRSGRSSRRCSRRRGAFWKGRSSDRWPRQRPGERRAALHAVSLHTSFFIACSGLTHGPPGSLQPGDPAIAIFKPAGPPVPSRTGRRPSIPASCTPGASRRPGRATSAASKFWKPPMPTRVHPFEIERDAFLRDVAVHPVPPHARAGGVRRIHETSIERVHRARRRVLRGSRCGRSRCRRMCLRVGAGRRERQGGANQQRGTRPARVEALLFRPGGGIGVSPRGGYLAARRV